MKTIIEIEVDWDGGVPLGDEEILIGLLDVADDMVDVNGIVSGKIVKRAEV